MSTRPRVTKLQRHILTRIADGWQLCSDGVYCCWLDSAPDCPVSTIEAVPMHTAERLILRHLVHPAGHLLENGWRAIGRTKP